MLAVTATTVTANENHRLQTLKGLCLLDTTPDPALDRITKLAAHTFQTQISLVSLVDKNRQWFKSKAGLDVEQTPLEDSFCAYAVANNSPLIVLDTLQDPQFANNRLVTGEPFIRFYAGYPLTTPEGVILGTLCIIDTKPREEFSHLHMETLRQFSALVMGRINTLRSVDFIDPATKLPNRSRFVEDIKILQETSQAPMTAVVLDICGNDYWNDMIKALGWEYAEGFIAVALNRIVSALMDSSIYRIAPTQFASLQSPQQMDRIAAKIKRLTERFNDVIDYQNIPHSAELSVGAIELHAGERAEDVVRSLHTAADMARDQKQIYHLYDPADGTLRDKTFQILSAIPRALSTHDQLMLRYQPKIDMKSGRCVAVEALIRWHHPELGDIAPDSFIPMAEKTALMRRITKWVLNAGLRQAAKWQRHGYRFAVALNVSAVDLDDPDFADYLASLLSLYPLDPNLIEIEFTESAFSVHPDFLKRQLEQIRGLGIHIAIDDFGSGYSNIAYLKDLPGGTLKIDQSFIRDMLNDERDRIVVQTMIRLGHQLGYRVVAEGIESEEIFNELRDWGCDEGQGYLMGKPMTAPELACWMERQDQRLQADHRKGGYPCASNAGEESLSERA